MSRIGVGIDFGTSNSSVALFDGERVSYVPVEHDAPRDVMPSALYLSRDLDAEVGREAIRAYIRENAGRVVELRAEDVGQIEVTVSGGDEIQGPKQEGGAITDVYAVHAFTDRDMPGRLFRSVKRWLGDASIEHVRVFGARYRIVALLTPMLLRLCERARQAAGARASIPWVGRPVRFEGRGEEGQRIAVRRLRESCGYAGLTDPVLHPEPIAAARSYLRGSPVRPGERVLVFDFGGGTLDLTVVRAGADDFEILSTYGIALGGDEIDRTLYRARLFPELGEGARIAVPIDGRMTSLPFGFRDFAGRLLNWPLAYELNRPDLRARIVEGAQAGGDAGHRLARLHELVTHNHAYRVFQAVEATKIALSDAPRAALTIPELDIELEVTRDEFEALLAPMLDQIRNAVGVALAAAELTPDDIAIVVRTGGSSRIPAVIDALRALFPGRVVEHDPFTGIAAGLAIASYEAGSGGAG